MHANSKAKIPPHFDFSVLPCLSTEEVEKLTAERPPTLEAASAIPGITPKALLYLYNELQAAGRKRKQAEARSADLLRREEYEARMAGGGASNV